MNPRRPTPSGPEPDPFDLARAPPHLALCSVSVGGLELFAVLPSVLIR